MMLHIGYFIIAFMLLLLAVVVVLLIHQIKLMIREEREFKRILKELRHEH